MAITSEMVRALREKTGLPMMECKKALEETGGNEHAAVELLRKKGLAQVEKRADRVTAEGRVTCSLAGNRAGLVEILCETAPVTGTDDFIQLANAAAAAAARLEAPTADALLTQSAPNGKTVGDLLHDAVNRIRENIKIGRVAGAQGHLGYYVHHDGRKGVLVEFSAPIPAEAAADVCMHIVAMRPPFTRREEVDPAMVAEKRVLATAEAQGKPPQMLEKIVSGKLDRWYAEMVLLEQPFVKDEKQSVGQYLRSIHPQLTINRAVRLEIGEVG
jgi:elongation factor Ts